MTITTYGDSQILEQIKKQLHKIVTVIKVMDFADMPAIEREMMFVKVQAEGPARTRSCVPWRSSAARWWTSAPAR